MAGQALIRVMTIRHRAWLASRLPPRLRRCRRVFPEDAGIGATAHMCAQAASLRSRSGWSPAAMSSTAAVSGPIPASSGKTRRHRLNRGGNREASHALWRIVITRMSAHPATRAYVKRRTAEGLSKKDIIRCLKRYVAREVYPCLRG